MRVPKLERWLMQRYWRLTRSLTIGAQGIVRDEAGRVLLVRHTYRPGWHFPGGGVEQGEDIETALARELDEEAGVAAEGRPRLLGIYTNFDVFPGDHIALFSIDRWHRLREPEPTREIAEVRFFERSAMPETTIGAVRRRLLELDDAVSRSTRW
jgi:8-oxo-dGTP pyrophosphatase MutT (NUDIX family)